LLVARAKYNRTNYKYYKNDLFKAKVVASVENQVVAEASMTFGLVEIKK